MGPIRPPRGVLRVAISKLLEDDGGHLCFQTGSLKCRATKLVIPSRNHKVILGSRRLQPAHAQVENLCHHLNANWYKQVGATRLVALTAQRTILWGIDLRFIS